MKEKSAFAGYHPAVNFLFFVLVIGITMFSMDPVFLVVTSLAGWTWSIFLSGRKAVKGNLMMTVPVVVVMVVVNGLFTHNGATVLFFINDSRITLEAMLYGLAGAVMLMAVIVWFTCFQAVMTSDKLIYLFGKTAPVLGLTLSMIFRFIPLLKSRFQEISIGQQCMGRHTERGLLNRVRQTTKEVSILISWSLEASIETSDSMEARGYGLKGRTSFHLFKFTGRDKCLMAFLAVVGGIAAVGCAMGKTTIYYYPKIVLGVWDVVKVVTLVCFVILMATPIYIDRTEEKRWQAYKSEI